MVDGGDVEVLAGPGVEIAVVRGGVVRSPTLCPSPPTMRCSPAGRSDPVGWSTLLGLRGGGVRDVRLPFKVAVDESADLGDSGFVGSP